MVLQCIATVHEATSLLLHSLAGLFRRTHRHDPPCRIEDGSIEGADEGHGFSELIGNTGEIDKIQ